LRKLLYQLILKPFKPIFVLRRNEDSGERYLFRENAEHRTNLRNVFDKSGKLSLVLTINQVAAITAFWIVGKKA
jgi:hypothetical protein